MGTKPHTIPSTAGKLVVLAVYAGPLVAPIVHALEDAVAPACAACAAAATSGPSWRADCSGGCHNPTHHHHHPIHDATHCVLCKSFAASVALAPAICIAPSTHTHRGALPTPPATTPRTSDLATSTIRGPPHTPRA
ncbi:MAG: hypothetical protein ACE5E6_09060 [Phycisphaerae bacterium]